MKTKPGTDLHFQIKFDPILRLRNGMKIPYFGEQLPEENKKKCREFVPIPCREFVGTSSISSSRETNNYLKTKGKERERTRERGYYFTPVILRKEVAMSRLQWRIKKYAEKLIEMDRDIEEVVLNR